MDIYAEFCIDFVFPNFNDQAQLMQYAALFLFTDRDLQDLGRFRCLPALGNLTNPNRPYYPYFNYVNYIVANFNRDRDFHAEETLCNLFEDVLSGFRNKNRADPKAILLYTYYFPCGDCANLIRSRLDIGVRLYLVYSEYSRNWTNIPLVEDIFDQSFVNMFQVQNANHRPPEESSSSEEETSSSEEEEELLEIAEAMRGRGRGRGRGRYIRGRGRVIIIGRGRESFRGSYRGRFKRGRGRGSGRGRGGYRGRRW